MKNNLTKPLSLFLICFVFCSFLEGQCTLTGSGLINIQCNDNGTPMDPTDDFITFDLDPTGTNLGTTYTVSGSASGSGSYGSSSSFSSATGTAGAGDLSITITDRTDPTCTLPETVADPGSCSSSCSISASGLTNIQCNDNGTPMDPTDDFITFDLDPTGTNLGATYTVSGSASGSGSYGSSSNFSSATGTAGAGNLSITITDDALGCTLPETVTDPGSCSNSCSISASGLTNIQCNDNGTPSDPTDDFITFDLNPTGINLGTTYTVSGGTSGSGSYGSSSSFSSAQGSAGTMNLNIIITDDLRSCNLPEVIQNPGTCSDQCLLSFSGLTNITCDNNGTIENPNDDKITFDLNPMGVNLASTYNVSMGFSPSNSAYNSLTNFASMVGTAGSGNLTLTISDAADPACFITETVTDPGQCIAYYVDADLDGAGDPNIPAICQCATLTPPIGRVTNKDDCDDTDPNKKPDQMWIIDEDNDGWGSQVLTQCDCPQNFGKLFSQRAPGTSGNDDCDDKQSGITNNSSIPVNDPMITECTDEVNNFNLSNLNNQVSSPFSSYSVQWYDGNPITGGTPLPNIVNLNSVNDLWARTIISSPNCQNEGDVSTNILHLPAVSSFTPVAPSVCAGINAMVNVTATSEADLTYNINGSSITIQRLNAGSATLTSPTNQGDPDIVFNLVRIDDGTCDDDLTNTRTITVNDNPVIDNAQTDKLEYCDEDIIHFTSSAIQGEGTLTNSSYQWSGPAVTYPQGPNPPIIAAPGFQGTHTVVVTDSNGCDDSLSTNIVRINPLPNAPVATGSDEICLDETITLNANPTPGTGGISSVVWSPSNSNTSINSSSNNSADVFGQMVGFSNITYLVTDAKGCMKESPSFIVEVNPLPARPTVQPAPFSRCRNSVFIPITANPNSSTGMETIDWFDEDGILIETGSTFYTPDEVAPGNFTFFAQSRNVTTGCKSENPLTPVRFSIFGEPEASFIYGPTSVRIGEKVQYFDTSQIGDNGASLDTFEYNFGSTGNPMTETFNINNVPTNSNRKFVEFGAPSGSQEIELIVTDLNQCKDTIVNPVRVFGVTDCVVSITGEDFLCQNGQEIYTASEARQTQFDTVTWSVSSNVVVSNQPRIQNRNTNIATIEFFEPAIYTVKFSYTEFDPLPPNDPIPECTGEVTFQVEVAPNPVGTFNFLNGNEFCEGDSIEIEFIETEINDPLRSFEVNFSNTFSSDPRAFNGKTYKQPVSIGTSSIEIISVVDPNGCRDVIPFSEPITVFENPTLVDLNADCDDNNTGYELEVIVSGGTNPFNLLVDGIGAAAIGNMPVRNNGMLFDNEIEYDIQVQDDNGCLSDERPDFSFDCESNCTNSAGAMTGELFICQSETTISSTDIMDLNTAIDNNIAGQRIFYVLHNGDEDLSLNGLVNFGSNPSDTLIINQTGDFSIVDLDPLDTYYTTVILANPASSGGFRGIDLQDACAKMAVPGAEIEILQVPTFENVVIPPPSCRGDDIEIQLEIEGEGNNSRRYDLDYTYDGTRTAINEIDPANPVLRVTDIDSVAGPITLEFNSLAYQGDVTCTNVDLTPASIPIEFLLPPADPAITNIVITGSNGIEIPIGSILATGEDYDFSLAGLVVDPSFINSYEWQLSKGDLNQEDQPISQVNFDNNFTTVRISVTIVDNNGCISIIERTFDVEVGLCPTIFQPINFPTDSVCVGESIELMAAPIDSSFNFDSLQWKWRVDGIDLNNQSNVLNYVPLRSGIIEAIATFELYTNGSSICEFKPDTITFTIAQTPDVANITGEDVACVGQNGLYVANMNTVADSYLWTIVTQNNTFLDTSSVPLINLKWIEEANGISINLNAEMLNNECNDSESFLVREVNDIGRDTSESEIFSLTREGIQDTILIFPDSSFQDCYTWHGTLSSEFNVEPLPGENNKQFYEFPARFSIDSIFDLNKFQFVWVEIDCGDDCTSIFFYDLGNNKEIPVVDIRSSETNGSLNSEIKLQLFPNPASDYLNLQIIGGKEGELFNVVIHDISGKQIKTDQIEQQQPGVLKYQLNTSQLRNSLYLMEVIGEKGHRTIEKFVIQR